MRNFVQIGIFLLALLFVLTACSTNRQAAIKPGDPRPTSRQLAATLGLDGESDRLPAKVYVSDGNAYDSAYTDNYSGNDSGDYAPATIDLTTLNGVSYSLKGYRGRFLLLDFFATYAVPSQSNMPILDKLYRKYKDHGLQVVGVSFDLQGKIMVDAFVETLDISYPILLAGDRLHTEHKTPYGYINEIPVALLIDPKGKLVKGYLGMLDEKTITEDIIDELDL